MQYDLSKMADLKIAVIGGGAAGYFSAITAAEAAPTARVVLFEATGHVLAKVRISGGGRCNTTHACFEPRELVKRYPRGSRELIVPESSVIGNIRPSGSAFSSTPRAANQATVSRGPNRFIGPINSLEPRG